MRRPAPEPSAARVPRRRAPSRLRRVISLRRGIQLAVGVGIFVLMARFDVSVGWIILAASAAGIVFGKFFCRWMCPLGAMMEMMLGVGGEEGKQKSLYQYFKVGCPIAWAGGLLNKLSLLRVKLRPDRCSGCGKCDATCYVSQLSTGASLHVAGQVNASTHYSCSRCLACVASCPTGALTIGGIGARSVPGRRTDARAA